MSVYKQEGMIGQLRPYTLQVCLYSGRAIKSDTGVP